MAATHWISIESKCPTCRGPCSGVTARYAIPCDNAGVTDLASDEVRHRRSVTNADKLAARSSRCGTEHPSADRERLAGAGIDV